MGLPHSLNTFHRPHTHARSSTLTVIGPTLVFSPARMWNRANRRTLERWRLALSNGPAEQLPGELEGANNVAVRPKPPDSAETIPAPVKRSSRVAASGRKLVPAAPVFSTSTVSSTRRFSSSGPPVSMLRHVEALIFRATFNSGAEGVPFTAAMRDLSGSVCVSPASGYRNRIAPLQ